MKVIEYVPRKVRTFEGEVVHIEDRIENALREKRFSLILGISGVGKSTTAEFISKIMSKEYVVVKLVPVDYLEGNFRVRVVGYGDSVVLTVFLSTEVIGVEERLLRLAFAISKVVSDFEKLGKEKFWDKFVKKFRKIFGGVEEKKQFLRHEIAITSEHLTMSVEELKKAFEELSDEYRVIIKGFESVGFKSGEVMSVVPIVDVTYDFLRATAGVASMIPYFKLALCITLTLLGILEIKEILEERKDKVFILRERLRDCVKKAEEKGRKILIVVDDFSRVESYREVLNFLRCCYDSGISILVVKRLRLGGIGDVVLNDVLEFLRLKPEERVWHAIKLFADVEEKVEFWGLGYEDLKECINLMFLPSYDEFVEIIRSNWEFVRRKRERLKGANLKLDFEKIKDDLEEWYSKTAGIPYLALSLMCYKEVKDVKLGKGGIYVSRDFLDLNEEEAEGLMNVIFEGYRIILKEIREREPHLIPVIIQMIAEDEALKFYGKDEMICDLLESSVEVYEEEWEDGNVKVFDLEREWIKLRDVLDQIAESDNAWRMRLINWRRKLVEIMTDRWMEVGETTGRMIFFALKHLEFLMRYDRDEGIERWYLIWLRHALQHLPSLGFRHALEGIEVAKKHKDVYAWAFLWELADVCRFYNVVKVILELGKALEIDVKDENSRAMKLLTVSSYLLTTFELLSELLSKLGYEVVDEVVNEILKSFDRVLREVEDLKVLKVYIKGWVLNDRANVLMSISRIYDAKRDLNWILENCQKLKFDSEEFFKPYGGKAEDKFKECLEDLIASTNYNLGSVLIDLRKFKDARDKFESALKIYKPKHFRNALKCKSFIKRIGILEGKDENFEDLFNEVERKSLNLTLKQSPLDVQNTYYPLFSPTPIKSMKL